MNLGLPTAATTISACFRISGRFVVFEWAVVTVAFSFNSKAETGFPKIGLRPTTTACFPSIGI